MRWLLSPTDVREARTRAGSFRRPRRQRSRLHARCRGEPSRHHVRAARDAPRGRHTASTPDRSEASRRVSRPVCPITRDGVTAGPSGSTTTGAHATVRMNGDRSRSYSGLSTTLPGAAGAASLDATARQPRVKNCHHHTYIRGKSCPLIVSSRRCHRRPSDGDSRTDGAERARDQ